MTIVLWVAAGGLLALGIWVMLDPMGALGALWREPVLKFPVVIVESDDWGVGPQSDALALRRISSVLGEIHDGLGQPAVMTLGLVLGSPDGPAILETECAAYRRTTLSDPCHAELLIAIREGCAEEVFALQRHGLEHCWPQSLLYRAKSDPGLRRWLNDPSARSESLPPALQSRWVDTSILPSRPLPAAAVAAAIEAEARLFRDLFGVAPVVAVPNTFVWDDNVEQAWTASGVTCIVTPGCRYEGRGADGKLLAPTRRLRNGQRNPGGAVYVVRDAYFEPMRGHSAEGVWQAVTERAALGRPTLLETHRESFIVGEEQLQRALAELARALRGVVLHFPQVRFMATAELARHLRDPASPLVQRSPWARLDVFLGRLAVDGHFGRILRRSGIGFLLGLVRGVMRSVKGDPLAVPPN